MKGLSLKFLEKARPIKATGSSTCDKDDKIIPFEWSKEVLSGKRKVVVSLPTQK